MFDNYALLAMFHDYYKRKGVLETYFSTAQQTDKPCKHFGHMKAINKIYTAKGSK
jgi:hypothetical protein